MRSENDPKVRKHIWIYENDWNTLQQMFGDSVGTSKAICKIIRSFLRKIEAKAQSDAKSIQLSIDPE